MSSNDTPTAKPRNLPSDILAVLAQQPENVDRRTGADLVTRHFFPVSYRTVEAWPLPTRRVNGKAIVPTAKLFELAYSKLVAAPVIMGGRRAPQEHRAA
jgi:hypothetical protein